MERFPVDEIRDFVNGPFHRYIFKTPLFILLAEILMPLFLQFLSSVWLFFIAGIGLLGTAGGLNMHAKSFYRKPAAENEPKLSFIVAVWNEGDRVRNCVESILGQ